MASSGDHDALLRRAIWNKLNVVEDWIHVRKSLLEFEGLLASISGLTAGFLLVFIGNPIRYEDYVADSAMLAPQTRRDVTTLLSGLAFICCMSSLLSSTINYGYINTAIARDADAVLSKIAWALDAPLQVLIFGIIGVFAAGIVAIGGVVSSWVWWILVSIGGLMILVMFKYRAYIRASVHSRVDEELRDMARRASVSNGSGG